MKSGFTLIELVIGLFISSIMLVLSLYKFLYYRQSDQSSEDIVNHDIHIAILAHQLEHDISWHLCPCNFQAPPPRQHNITTTNSQRNKNTTDQKESHSKRN